MSFQLVLLLFIAMVFIHFLLDFPLQSDFIAMNKGNNNYLLFVHSFIWGAGVFFIPAIFGAGVTFYFLFFLVVGHYCIDKWKCNRKDKSIALTIDLYIDQFLHFLQIIIYFTWILVSQ